MEQRVEITTDGRSGRVRYVEVAGTIDFHWEFGSGDAVAIVQVLDLATWQAEGAWFHGRKKAILRSVADEVIRQKAPHAHAEIDEEQGDILLRQVSRPSEPSGPDAPWVTRYRAIRMRIGVGVLLAGLIFGGVYWMMQRTFSIDPGKGTPIGSSVRTDTHIATLIQTLEPYVPSLNRDHGKDTYRISLFLVPLDGSDPKLVPLIGGLSPNSSGLAKILGSDGQVLWYDVAGTGGVDLRNNNLLSEAEVKLARSIPEPVRSNGMPFGPGPEHYLAAGYFIGPNTWLGLHSTVEAQRSFKPKSWLKRVVQAEEAKQMRQFHRAELDPDTTDAHHRIVAIQAIDPTEYLNAAFLRMDERSEPIRPMDPPSALMIHTSEPGLKGTLMVSRADTSGRILWSVDTGIDRFKLQQILPGNGSVAFIGTRLPIPGKVSEPLLVVIENGSGRIKTTSLWR